MPDSIPQWVTDIESDEIIFKKKSNVWRAGILGLIIIYFIGGSLLLPYNKLYFAYFLAALLVIFVILIFYRLGTKKPDLPNLLATNLYRIGTELEALNASSPSYIKRNKQYLKTSQNIINKFIIEDDDGFVENYNNFFKNLGDIFLRLNCLYLKNSKPDTVVSISGDLKMLAESIHEDNKNLAPVHTAYVNGILSNLQNIEPLALDTPYIGRLYNSFTIGWHNISYSYRTIIILLVYGIIIFVVLSSLMIYILNMGKSESIGYAIVATMTFMGGLVTQIDKILPKK